MVTNDGKDDGQHSSEGSAKCRGISKLGEFDQIVLLTVKETVKEKEMQARRREIESIKDCCTCSRHYLSRVLLMPSEPSRRGNREAHCLLDTA